MLTAFNAANDDCFGVSVAMESEYAVAGAAYKTVTYGEYGAAYIFHRTGTDTWDSGIRLTAYDRGIYDYFGRSVSISGDYVVVGANGAGSTSKVAAYVFNRTGINTWDGGVKIEAFDAQDNDEFGNSVTISGDYVVIGAYKEDGTIADEGAAYVFTRTGTNIWSNGPKLKSLTLGSSEFFGKSVSMSGNYTIVGAYLSSGGGKSNCGSAYLIY